MDNFDSLVDDNAAPAAVATPDAAVPAAHQPMGFDSLVDDQEKYDGLEQQAKAGAEGLAKGVLGPAAPYLEKHVLGVHSKDILGREKANPITESIGQGVGLVGGALTGVGEGAVMEAAGKGAAELAGLATPASYMAKVGSAAVKSAAEMAVLQSGDEASKMILNDPEASAQSAIANIGLATALGGAGGAFVTGAVSPLWEATVGKHVGKFLGGLQEHLNGGGLKVSADIDGAAKTLGLELSPELRAGMSGSPKAAQVFNELREVQHPTVIEGLKNLERDSNTSIINSLGRSPEEIANYSEAEGGKHAMDSFKNEYKAKYEPIAKEYEAISEPFKATEVAPGQLSELADKVASVAQEKGYLGADIPQTKVINAVIDRIPGIKTVQDLAKLNTIVDNISGNDLVLQKAGRDMKNLILDTQQNVMGNAIQKDAPEMFQRYLAARQAYADLSKVSENLGAELSLGRFAGPKTFLARLAEKRSPEQFLSKLSPKGNAEIIPFLQKHFPQTLESIRDNEFKQILKPAVLGAKGEQEINARILNNAIEKGLAGQKERINFAIPQEVLDKVRAANTIQSAIPGMKSSGTAGWQQKMMAHVPQSAMSMVAMFTGHNPVLGYIAGGVGKILARDMPDAVKLGLLKFMASEKPIEAKGFKAMVEFMHNTIKGENMLTKATGAVLKAGAQVLTDKMMPSKADREKLDKVVTKLQENPDQMLNLTNGHTGHYMPDHQTALTETNARAVQYLQSLKPHPYKAGPLDREIQPTPEQTARYNRALDIAHQPMMVMQHVKDGTIQASDIQDLKAMYPALYSRMTQKLSDQMIHKTADEEPIPYKTRIGLSLFLGQPIDSSMTSSAIQAAQPKPKAPPPEQQGSSKAMTKKGGNALNKMPKSYMTPGQASEADRNKRAD